MAGGAGDHSARSPRRAATPHGAGPPGSASTARRSDMAVATVPDGATNVGTTNVGTLRTSALRTSAPSPMAEASTGTVWRVVKASSSGLKKSRSWMERAVVWWLARSASKRASAVEVGPSRYPSTRAR